jgi:hypothetical protein
VQIISDTEAHLYYDPGRALPVGDPKGIFVTVALGVFIEHLSIAAANTRQEVVVSKILEPVKTTATKLTKFAELRLVPRQIPEALDRELIKKRRTSRLQYNGAPVSEPALSGLKDEAFPSGHEVSWSSDRKIVDHIIQLNQQTLFEDLASAADRNELNSLFRYNDKEAEARKDGLWARCMGFPGKLMKSVFSHHQRWEHGLRKTLLSDYYKKSFKGTPTIAWMTGKFNSTGDWVTAGRVLARCWLLLTREGIYIHPFGSLITNAAAYNKINQLFTLPDEEKKIWMIFRAGYSKEPARSYRLDTDEIIIK